MSNPFAQGGGDPFGDFSAPNSQQQQPAALKPSRRAPPKPAVPGANPFAAPAAPADDDPFDLLAATAPVANSSNNNQQQATSTAQDDDVFGLFSSAQRTTAGTTSTSTSTNVAAAPPSYNEAAALPPPPAYDSAVALPPAYEAAGTCPPAPPSYEQAVAPKDQQAAAGGVGAQSATQPKPARAPPGPPGGHHLAAAGVGPLTAARPARAAPVAPGSAVTPARPAPVASPAGHAGPLPSRPAPRAPAAAAAGDAAGQLSGLQLGADGGGCIAATTGNVGAAPKGSVFGGQQVHQQELGAQVRLPPLNPKATAPLKHLAAGLGSLFAGPVDDTTLLLQWSPSVSGNTLPMGSTPAVREDHDSAAAAALSAGQAAGSKARVSAVLFGPVPGWLWAGNTDGRVHCWSVKADGSAAWLVHSWEAHSGKIKALALSPCGRLFTGSSNGSIKMWSYGSPAFCDSSEPRFLRQLRKVDPRSGVGASPHSKVVGLAVSTGGRVLWSVGKESVSLWSTHNGEHLGSIRESGLTDTPNNPFAAQYGYGSPYAVQPQNPGGAPPGDINPKQGLDMAILDGMFERPSAELLAEEDTFDTEKDAASVAYNAAVKGAAKAGKLFNKLTKMAAARIMEEEPAAGGSGSTGSAGGVGSAARDAEAGLADKTERWGSIKKIAAAADGTLWLSYKRGLLEKYSEAGQLLWNSSSGSLRQDRSPAAAGGSGGGGSSSLFKPAGGITAVAAVGSSTWVGDQEGRIWVLDAASGSVQRAWKAHVLPVRSIAAAGHLVYSLGKAGSIRAWPATAAPTELTVAWRADTADCLEQQTLQVLASTWNVNETKPSRPGLELWLEKAKDAQLVLIGLQEVEMGTGSVALDVVYQNLAKAKLEAGTQAAQAWATAINDVLCNKGAWKRVALRQMSGILALVYARAELEPHIGEVSTASVACGVMGYGGNKGAAAISMSVFRRRVTLVSSHFAAHQEKVDARNADYAKILRHLHFHNVPTDKPQQQSQYEAADSVVLGSSEQSEANPGSRPQQQQQQQHGALAAAAAGGSGGGGAFGDDDWGAGMKDAEFLVWLGDFNYRVDSPEGFVPDRLNPERSVNDQLYHFVLQKIAARQHTDLLTGDQCSREMSRGIIFHGLAEGPISFLPTYKFEKGRESSIVQPFYDQGEKMRVPAWTDRVFFRGSAPQRAALTANPADTPADVRVSLASRAAYTAVLEVNDSDHKPVNAQLQLQLPWYQQQQLRSTSLARLWQVAQLRANGGPSSKSSRHSNQQDGRVVLSVQPPQLVLTSSHAPSHVVLQNPLADTAVSFMVCSGAAAIPTWLEVVPASGVLGPGDALRLRVQANKGGSWGKPGGGLGCELKVVACVEGSVDSSVWPLGLAGSAAAVSVVLH